jgi:hypothetical protein
MLALSKEVGTYELEVLFGNSPFSFVHVEKEKGRPEAFLVDVFAPADGDHPTDCSLMHFLGNSYSLNNRLEQVRSHLTLWNNLEGFLIRQGGPLTVG